MTYKMKALRTFASTEGLIKKGETFEVKELKRASQLGDAGLAEMIENEQPSYSMEDEAPLPEEQKPDEVDPPYDEPPSKGERWGVEALGGGWYELPCGERIQGFEEAKRKLYENLETNFRKHGETPSASETPYDEEVSLIEPVNEPKIVEPKIVFTDDIPNSEEVPNDLEESFENEVSYLGGGWYELPNGERVQGKESAMDLFETYRKE